MACYSCGSSFGLFKKELGCKNCGYAFCKDCLTKKAAIPKLKNERHRVCLKCYKILTGEITADDKKVKYSPPEALRKRMAKLENQGPAATQHTATSRTSQPINTHGMSKEDIAIATRLQKLKDNKDPAAPPVPTLTEMNERLKKLKEGPASGAQPSQSELSDRLSQVKGHDPAAASKPHVFAPERRPQAQQVDDLLQEICDEVEIDSHRINYSEDVQNRLDKYRGLDDKPGDLQNNLNSPTSKDQFHYTKNIPHIGPDYSATSCQHVDWSEMNQLISQVATELDVDAAKAVEGLKKDKELWDRLSRVKQKKDNTDKENEDASCFSAPTGEDIVEEEEEENEEEACKNIIKQLLEESRLEEDLEEEEVTGRRIRRAPAVPKDTHSNQSSARRRISDEFIPDEDELPYCCMCNEDPTFRCLGCDGDLYCKRCYKEGHDREDYKDHKTKPYKPSNKSGH